FGFYTSADYQFARRWYAGARYDRSARPLEASTIDTGGSFYLTYWPSEFSQMRGQYRRTNYGDGVDANEFLFQFLFSIGAHGAHVF
ncbi:MAG: TonB-dependent receptor, partial [Acidobacteriota bacterium]|nr:TonB-dependent receptor [Acidobacteriota bacterium]